MAQRIGIVCGYSPNEDDTNKFYWGFVIDFCNEARLDTLFLSGGFTRKKSLPGVSEAAAMRNYIRPRLTGSIPLFIEEEDSYTSFDNIRNVAELMTRFNLLSADTSIVIFCHVSKRFLIEKLARHFFGSQRPILIESTYWKMGVADVLLQPIITLGMLAARRQPWIAKTWRTIQMWRYARM